MAGDDDLETVRENMVLVLKKDSEPFEGLEDLSPEDLWNEFTTRIVQGKFNLEEEECLKAMVGFLKGRRKKLVGSGSSGLHLAVLAHNECLVRALLQMGATVDVRDDNGATPLYLAVDEGQLGSAAILLGRGASVDARLTCFFRRGYSPLHSAALQQDADAARLLILHGAPLEARDESGATPLYTAVEWGHVEPAKALIAAGADVDTSLTAVFKCGYTGMHVAAEAGRDDMVTLLLASGADPNLIDAAGESALHVAIETDHFVVAEIILRSPNLLASAVPKDILHVAASRNRCDMIKLVLKKDVNINSTDDIGRTALHIAAEKGYDEIVRQLIRSGANVNFETPAGFSPLHLAAASGKVEAARSLLEAGCLVNSKTAENVTPLHEACSQRRGEVVVLLLEYGADVDAKTGSEKTPLLLAVEKRYTEIVTKLLQAVPDINHPENRKAFRTAVDSFCIGMVIQLNDFGFHFDEIDAKDPQLLCTCVENGYVELVRDLLNLGAEVTTINLNNKSLLHSAIKNGWTDFEMTNLLLTYGIDVNSKDGNGQTPLFYAVASGRTVFEAGELIHPPQYHACRVVNPAVVNKLISNGAEVTVSDIHGTTPLHISVFQQDYDLARLLLENGALPNRKHNDGTIPLHIAVQRNDLNLVKLLIRFGSDIDAQDYGGVSALHLAVQNQNLEMVVFLIEEGADIESQVSDGSRAIHLATAPGCEAILEVLVGNGAHIEAEDFRGRRPLHLAASRGIKAAVGLLVACGAYIDARRRDGRTALHIALTKRHSSVVSVLLTSGADPDLWASEETPLHVAVARSAEMVRLLLDAGAEIDSEDILGQTPLLLATLNGAAESADMLLKYGANLCCCDLNGRVPFDFVHLKNPSRTIDKVIMRAICVWAAVGLLPETFVSERSQFQHECIVEADFIRAKPLIPGFTFHSVLTARLPRLMKFARNADVLNLLDVFNFEKLYPIYGIWIRTKLQNGYERNNLIDLASSVLLEIVPYWLPTHVCRNIFSFLTNSELRLLTKHTKIINDDE